MEINKIDNVEFRLNKTFDWTWLQKYGTAFTAFDETGSGCFCLGFEKESTKYFCKIAGADTIFGEITPEKSVEQLKKAAVIYKNLKHENLINLIENYAYKDLYICVFQWALGECLFDHWNFEKYSEKTLSPKDKFKKLSTQVKLQSCEVLFDFLKSSYNKGYVPIDFYDGSIIYDFENNITTICDIDFFTKAPVINNIGENWMGTKRFKAPEEYILNAKINERSTVFSLAALIMDCYFGNFTTEEINLRYTKNQFTPCNFEKWQLNKKSYDVIIKATNPNPEKRYATLEEFHLAWKLSLDYF